MVPDLEKSPVTELHVRMDCNGCVHRIKKAIHRLDGVYSVTTDITQQKLTVVGNIDPAMIVKAIKKARKIATIYSHTDPAVVAEPPPAEPAPEAPAEAAAPPTEPAPPPPETPVPDVKPPPEMPKDVRETAEIHMVHHYPQSYGHYPASEPYEAQPYYVASSHSYNSHRPSNYTVQYGHNYIRSPPRDNTHYSGSVETYNDGYYDQPRDTTHYRGAETYNDGYYDQNRGGNRDGGQVGSMFSDENPNACRII